MKNLPEAIEEEMRKFYSVTVSLFGKFEPHTNKLTNETSNNYEN